MQTVFGIKKGTFYRYCRMAHAYLSAAAFIMLMFFAASGILLNHPTWFGAERKSDGPILVQLDGGRLTEILSLSTPGPAVAAMVQESTSVRGAFKSAEVSDLDIMLRFTGVKGTTDVFVDVQTGLAEVEVSRANLTSVIHDLHRGKEAGVFWKTAIDLTAIVILTLSIAGLILFFSLRFRLATSMKIMAATLGAFIGLFVFLTP